MPQMAPMNWIILMIYFIMVFFMFNTINYFIFCPKISNKKTKTYNQSTLTWKW